MIKRKPMNKHQKKDLKTPKMPPIANKELGFVNAVRY